MRGVIVFAIFAVAAGAALADGGPVVTSGSSALPAGCDPATLASRVVAFTDAAASGDDSRLDTLFAQVGPNPRDQEVIGEAGFVEYTVTTASSRTTVYERDKLLAYFAARHTKHEQLRLIVLQAVPDENEYPWRVYVSLKLLASADDLGASRVELVKAGFNCRSGTIFVWVSSAMRRGEPIGGAAPCAEPAGWSPGAPVVACAARPTAWPLSDDFSVSPTPLKLPSYCAPTAVQSLLVGMLKGLNGGSATRFAAGFEPDAGIQPYTGADLITLRGRRAIRRWFAARAVAREGWTMRRLHPPTAPDETPGQAVYLALFDLTSNGNALGPAGTKIVVSCRSGLIRWAVVGRQRPRIH